jgi:hypothetical protein
MGATGPVNPAAADQPAGHGPGRAVGSPAALALAVARAPFTGWAWRELLFCAIEVPLGFCVLVFPIALLGLPLAVTLLVHGGPRPAGPTPAHPGAVFGGVVLVILLALLVLTPRIARRLGAAHRRLAARLLGEDIPGPPPLGRGRGVAGWLGATVRDGPGWRAAAYLLVKLPVTVGELYAAFFAAAGLANLTYPFWWPLFRNHPPDVRLGPVYALTPFGGLRIETFPGTFAACAAGAAMVLAAPWAARAVSSADRWLMRGLLGPGRLAQRVADLEQSRALAVDDSAATLRRLERDLHDGAQVRLATLAMNLGMAREKLGDDASPEVRELVEMVFSQLAKGPVRSVGRGWQHVADLDVAAGDDHAVDEQLGQLPSLGEGGGGQPGPDGLAECLDPVGDSGEFQPLLGSGVQLTLLGLERGAAAVQFLPFAFQLRQRDHFGQVGVQQPLLLAV